MRNFLVSFARFLPFTIGVVLVLTSLSFLVEFTSQSLDIGDLVDENFWIFVLFSIVGIPTLLYGINKASNLGL